MYGPVCEFRSSLTGFPAACSTSSRLLTLIHVSLPPRMDNSQRSYADGHRSENVATVGAFCVKWHLCVSQRRSKSRRYCSTTTGIRTSLTPLELAIDKSV